MTYENYVLKKAKTTIGLSRASEWSLPNLVRLLMLY